MATKVDVRELLALIQSKEFRTQGGNQALLVSDVKEVIDAAERNTTAAEPYGYLYWSSNGDGTRTEKFGRSVPANHCSDWGVTELYTRPEPAAVPVDGIALCARDAESAATTAEREHAESIKRWSTSDNPWYAAVTDACANNHMPWDYSDAYGTLRELICRECEMALDPDISSDAQALIDIGRDEREPTAAVPDEASYANIGTLIPTNLTGARSDYELIVGWNKCRASMLAAKG